MLRVQKLSVSVNGKSVVRNISLSLEKGEKLVLFGPNGSGKTSFLMCLSGVESYKVTAGKIVFAEKNITPLPAEERVKMGIVLAFQNPPRIKGVKFETILKICTKIGKSDMNEISKIAEELGVKELFKRELYSGFSGGEIKKCELLQAIALNPKLLLLDEPDSGVDAESIKSICKVLSRFLEEEERSAIIITHSGEILNHLKIEKGAVMYSGKIICTGKAKKIFETIKKHGYERCAQCIR